MSINNTEKLVSRRSRDVLQIDGCVILHFKDGCLKTKITLKQNVLDCLMIMTWIKQSQQCFQTGKLQETLVWQEPKPYAINYDLAIFFKSLLLSSLNTSDNHVYSFDESLMRYLKPVTCFYMYNNERCGMQSSKNDIFWLKFHGSWHLHWWYNDTTFWWYN